MKGHFWANSAWAPLFPCFTPPFFFRIAPDCFISHALSHSPSRPDFAAISWLIMMVDYGRTGRLRRREVQSGSWHLGECRCFLGGRVFPGFSRKGKRKPPFRPCLMK